MLFRSETFGIGEIRTPAFEFTELFARGVGETTDIVQKEMYTFTDDGDYIGAPLLSRERISEIPFVFPAILRYCGDFHTISSLVSMSNSRTD